MRMYCTRNCLYINRIFHKLYVIDDAHGWQINVSTNLLASAVVIAAAAVVTETYRLVHQHNVFYMWQSVQNMLWNKYFALIYLYHACVQADTKVANFCIKSNTRFIRGIIYSSIRSFCIAKTIPAYNIHIFNDTSECCILVIGISVFLQVKNHISCNRN